MKFIVSPYTPINAYFAVFLQTILGFILFWGGFNKISPIILGFLSLFLSGIQKIIIITVVFGMTFWESIDVFIEFVVNRIFPNYYSESDLIFSFVIVGTYMSIHIIGGILAGVYASKLPFRINSKESESLSVSINNFNGYLNSNQNKKKKTKWWLKPSSILILIFSLLVIGISFLFEDVDKSFAMEVVIMLLRSVIIIVVWYYFLSPLLLRILNKFLAERKKKHLEELNKIVDVFPNIRSVVKHSWALSGDIKGLRKPFFLMDNVLITYLLYDSKFDEE